MFKINKKIIISAIIAGAFLTLFTSSFPILKEGEGIPDYVEYGLPDQWIDEYEGSSGNMNVHYSMLPFIIDVIFWTIVSFIIITIFMRYKIPF